MKTIKVFDSSDLWSIVQQLSLEYDLGARCSYEYLQLQANGIFLPPNAPPVTLVLPTVNPTWVKSYYGFDISMEIFIEVAIGCNGQYYYYDGNQWNTSASPVFTTPELVRQGIASYPLQSIQLQLKLCPGASLSRVAIGIDVFGDPLDYLYNFALPAFFSCSIPISLVGRINNSQVNFAQRNSLDYQRITNLVIQKFQGSVISSQLVEQNILTSSLQENGVMVSFDYTIPAQYATEDILYQVTDIPSVLLRRLDSIKQRIPVAQTSVKTPTDSETITLSLMHNEVVEVTIFAETETMLNQIYRFLEAKIYKNGKISVTGMDWDFFLHLQNRTFHINRSSNNTLAGLLFRGTFQVVFHRVPNFL